MTEKSEIRLIGRAVSRGIAIGPASCLFGSQRQFFRRHISTAEIDDELERFENGRSAALRSIESDLNLASSGLKVPAVEMFEAHLLILNDPALVSKVRDSISRGKANAEWAVQNAVEGFFVDLQSANEHFREKYLDLQDVAERVVNALDAKNETIQFKEGSIVIASELRASTLLHFREAGIAGIVTELGGWTSHFSILAREFEIPAVSGIGHVVRSIPESATVAVDGFKGEVLVDPSHESLSRIASSSISQAFAAYTGETGLDKALTTLDGHPITIRTNTNTVETYKKAEKLGARGIGLYRSESLIGRFGRVPSENEQRGEYESIANAAGDSRVCIRMFDIDSERSGGMFRRQKNPALGLRAIRLSFRDHSLLLPQLRAILRTSLNNDVAIIVPMVTGVSEMREFRSVLDQQRNIMTEQGVKVGSLPVGAMIEIPSAAVVVDQLADVSDFLCLGTNDLAQYFLAADRDNEFVSEWFRTLHPAILRIVRSVIEKCRDAGKQLIVCGEMAGSPFYVPVLIGMGASDLSIGPGSIESVRRVVAGIAFEEASALVRELFELSTPQEVEQAVLEAALQKWAHLYPPGFLEQRTG